MDRPSIDWPACVRTPSMAEGVGLGEWRVSSDPEEVLAAYGLGSCVAVALHDNLRVAGLAHVVLPDSRGDPQGQPGKYADTAVPNLVQAIRRAGGVMTGLRAVICGGASMFQLANLPEVGSANLSAVRQGLAALRIPLLAEDVGGRRGRTMRLEVGTGRARVSTAGGGEIDLWIRPPAQG